MNHSHSRNRYHTVALAYRRRPPFGGTSTPDSPERAAQFLYSERAHRWAQLLGIDWPAVLEHSNFSTISSGVKHYE